MVYVSKLSEEKKVFVLHSIEIRGAINSREYSIAERYHYIQKVDTEISASTFWPSYDDDDKHLFTPQGFIISEGNIVNADTKELFLTEGYRNLPGILSRIFIR